MRGYDMMIRKTTSLFILLITTASVVLPMASLPRKSPEFTITEPGGKTTMLSSFRGKVVVVEFLFLGSEHCMRVAMTMNKLNGELGSRGFQPVGVAFGPNADAANTYLVSQSFKLKFPVGYASTENVDSYLARGPDDILSVPQVVVIDRVGTIRAQSGGRPGDPKLENEDSLRSLLDSLLKESPATESPVNSHPPSATKTQL
jgi:peroxiredoxin